MNKKCFLKWNIAIVFLVVLFANTVLAVTDAEVINLILDNATKGAIDNGGFGVPVFSDGQTMTESYSIPYIAFDHNKIDSLLPEGYSFEIKGNGVLLKGPNGEKQEYTIAIGTDSSHIASADINAFEHDFKGDIRDNEYAGVDFAKDYYDDSGSAYQESSVEVITFVNSAVDEESPWRYEDGKQISFVEKGAETTIVAKNAKTGEEIVQETYVDNQYQVQLKNNQTVEGTEITNNIEQSNPQDSSQSDEPSVPITHLDRGETGTVEMQVDDSHKVEGGHFVQFQVDEDGRYRFTYDLRNENGEQLYFDISQTDNGYGIVKDLIYEYENGAYSQLAGYDYNNEGETAYVLEKGKTYGVFMPDEVSSYSFSANRFDKEGDSLEGDYAFGEMSSDINDENKDEEKAEWYEKIIAWFIRLLGKILQALIGLIAGQDISIDSLVFDRYTRTQVTFFESDIKEGYYKGMNPLLEGAIDPINDVYSLFRKIAIVIYMGILVYMGIRMLLTIGNPTKKAGYKDMLLYWIKGVAILFFFPYIIRYTMLVNHAFVTYIYENMDEQLKGQGTIKSQNGDLSKSDTLTVDDLTDDKNSNYMYLMYQKAYKSQRIADAICWFIMITQVLQFLIVYLKRLISIGFLICIFPLVTITYAIDRAGDGRAQAFNNWFKDFILQIFIQSFHAVNYVLMMGIILRLDNSNWFLKIAGITYVAKGGDIIKSLFAQMKGGTGKAGGPLEVAKSLAMTQLAINGMKSIRGIASKTFGSKSLLGKGVGKLGDMHDKIIFRNTNRALLEADEFYKKYNKNHPTITWEKIDDSVAKALGKDTSGGTKTKYQKDVDTLEAIEVLKQLSPEQLQSAINRGRLSKEEIAMLDDMLSTATAVSVIGTRKRQTNIAIHTAVDVMINFKEKPTKGYTRYMDARRGVRVDTDQYRNEDFLGDVAVAHSVAFAKESRVEEDAYTPPAKPTELRDQEKQVRDLFRTAVKASEEEEDKAWRDLYNAAQGSAELERALKNEIASLSGALKTKFEAKLAALIEEMDGAYKGELTKKELTLTANLATLLERNDSDFAKKLKGELHYTADAFQRKVAVETINTVYDDPRGVFDPALQAEINEAIGVIKGAPNDRTSKEIFTTLRTNRRDLETDKIPVVKEQESEESMIRKEISKKMGIDEVSMLGNLSEEQVAYLEAREKELTAGIRHDAIVGAVETVGGSVLGLEKAALEVTTGAAVLGATASQKPGQDALTETLAIVPGAMSTAGDAVGKLENLGGKIIGLGTDLGADITDRIHDIRGTSDEYNIFRKGESAEVIRQSMEINQKKLREENQVKLALTEAERERQRLLDKIKREAGKRT